MKEMYMLFSNPADKEDSTDKNMALFRVDDDAVKELHPIESTIIDREFAPLQLYACDKALIPDTDFKIVHLSSSRNNKAEPAVYTLMIVSHPFPRQSVILTSAQFNREEYRGGAGMFIEPFIEILRKEPVETLAATARKLLREMSDANTLLKKDGSSMTYDDMMDLLL